MTLTREIWSCQWIAISDAKSELMWMVASVHHGVRGRVKNKKNVGMRRFSVARVHLDLA